MAHIDGTSEHISKAEPLSIDEAKKKLKLGGDKAKAFEQKIIERQDGQFSQIMSIVFGWKLQEDGSKKLMSKMPSGKALFADRSEVLEEIEPGVPYMCLVYDRKEDEEGRPGREAFAKIICREYKPKIYVPTNHLPVMVWNEESGKVRNEVPHGNSYAERIMKLIIMAEEKGFPSVDIVYRKNQGKLERRK